MLRTIGLVGPEFIFDKDRTVGNGGTTAGSEDGAGSTAPDSNYLNSACEVVRECQALQ